MKIDENYPEIEVQHPDLHETIVTLSRSMIHTMVTGHQKLKASAGPQSGLCS